MLLTKDIVYSLKYFYVVRWVGEALEIYCEKESGFIQIKLKGAQ